LIKLYQLIKKLSKYDKYLKYDISERLSQRASRYPTEDELQISQAILTLSVSSNIASLYLLYLSRDKIRFKSFNPRFALISHRDLTQFCAARNQNSTQHFAAFSLK